LLKAIGLRQAVEFAIASLPYPNQHPDIARRLKQALLATEGWESVTLRSALDDEYDIITLDGEAITDIQQQMGSNYTCLIGGRHTNLHETSVVYVRRR
jgi:hypothetical protein